ncbi:hypothetical protein K474DRAFT_763986 [Panus rudis PR-1116 ss-1]|nr:hypothetical protein K474DRAFT_763986 [Panus rudis PR-1116 ss-1]
MAGEIVGLDQLMPLVGYNERYKLMRKMTNGALNHGSIKKYEDIQYDAVRFFLGGIFRDPTDFYELSRRNVARFILRFAYGLQGEMVDSEYISDSKAMMHTVTTVSLPGSYLVDFLPWLRYLPHWFPFTEFQRIGKECRDQLQDFHSRPLRYVKEQLDKATATDCMVADLLREIEAKMN